MNDNYNYVLKNLGVNLTNNEWLMHIKKFFGEKQTKKFCEYMVDARNICRKNDIRNIIYSGSMSVFSMIDNEQLAIFNIFKPIDIENNIVKNIGLEKIKTKYTKRDMELDNEIKKYGYSYSKIRFYFRVENIKDTFQSKYVNVVCSEKSTEIEENVDFDIDTDIGDIFKAFFETQPSNNYNDENNIFINCKLNKNECKKIIKYKRKEKNNKRTFKKIEVKIPSDIKEEQKIIIHGCGNYIKEKDNYSDLVINILVKGCRRK